MEKYFQGINITLFYKNKHIFEKNFTIVCSEKNFQYRLNVETSYLIDCFTNQLTGFNMVQFFTEMCFLTGFNCSHCN